MGIDHRSHRQRCHHERFLVPAKHAMLRRRLTRQNAAIQLEKGGRGRMRLVV